MAAEQLGGPAAQSQVVEVSQRFVQIPDNPYFLLDTEFYGNAGIRRLIQRGPYEAQHKKGTGILFQANVQSSKAQ